LAKSLSECITRLYLAGHTLEEIREYPISRLRALEQTILDIEDKRDAHLLHLNALAAQGTGTDIDKTRNILLGKVNGR